MRNTAAALALAFVGAAISLSASDRVGVYAVVDKVVFEPSVDNPERLQIWGAFALATRNDRDLYDTVQRGFLYYTVADSTELTRREWADLKTLAGTQRIVAFGSRFGQAVHVRGEREEPQAPDKYVLGVGVQVIRSDRDYAPIKALAAHISR